MTKPTGNPRGRPHVEWNVTEQIRLTQGQADKLRLLGGSAWVRKRIDRAKDREREQGNQQPTGDSENERSKKK
jgi:hypothetical protein